MPESAAEVLTRLLAHGEIDGRTAMQRMAELGFSPKQVRGARESLGVTTERTGFGSNYRSRWRLPEPVAPTATPTVVPTETVLPNADVSAPPADEDYMKRPLESVDVDDLSGEHLKRYAKRVGIRQVDIDNLTPDRLRWNVKLAIAHHFELLTTD